MEVFFKNVMNCENCAWLDIACIAVIGSEYRNWFTILIMNIYQYYHERGCNYFCAWYDRNGICEPNGIPSA